MAHRRVFLKRHTFAGTALAVTILLSGCAAPSDGPARAPSPSPTPSPTAARLVEPVSALPLACADLTPARLVATIVGADASDQRSRASAVWAAADRQAGILTCSWTTEREPRSFLNVSLERHSALKQADTEYGQVVAAGLPGADIGADLSGISCSANPASGTDCSISAIVGDYALTMSTYSAEPVGDVRSALHGAATTTVSRLRADPVPPVWERPASAWPADLDCAKVAAAADLSAATGVPGLEVVDVTGYGEDYHQRIEVASIGGSRNCLWNVPASTDDRPFAVALQTVAGGGWAFEPFTKATTGRRVRVPGADEAVITCDSTGGCSLEGRIGQNVFSLGSWFYSADLTEAQTLAAAGAVAAALRADYGG